MKLIMLNIIIVIVNNKFWNFCYTPFIWWDVNISTSLILVTVFTTPMANFELNPGVIVAMNS